MAAAATVTAVAVTVMIKKCIFRYFQKTKPLYYTAVSFCCIIFQKL